MYTLVGFMRAPEPLEIGQFESILDAKLKSVETIKKRIQALRELSSKPMTAEERSCALKTFIGVQILEDPNLVEDPLYQGVLDIIANGDSRS